MFTELFARDQTYKYYYTFSQSRETYRMSVSSTQSLLLSRKGRNPGRWNYHNFVSAVFVLSILQDVSDIFLMLVSLIAVGKVTLVFFLISKTKPQARLRTTSVIMMAHTMSWRSVPHSCRTFDKTSNVRQRWLPKRPTDAWDVWQRMQVFNVNCTTLQYLSQWEMPTRRKLHDWSLPRN